MQTVKNTVDQINQTTHAVYVFYIYTYVEIPQMLTNILHFAKIEGIKIFPQ